MDPITIMAVAKGLAAFVPGLVRWVGGDKAGDVAEQAVKVAQNITGIQEPDAALEEIRKNPELQIRLQEAMTPILLAQIEAETRQMEQVNATMRAELASNSLFKSCWRPAFGWAVVITWMVQMGSVSYVMVTNVAESATLVTAMSSLSFMWGLALSVLGINIAKRSQDKQVSVGANPMGMLGALAQRIAGGKRDG